MSGMTPLPTVLTLIDPNPTMDQLQALQRRMIELGGDTVGPAVEHFFADGLYGRRLKIPAGTLLMGKLQRKSNITIQLYGDIEVTTDSGPKRIVGHSVFTAPEMTKRIGWTHMETVWLTVHATTETDIEKIEQDLIIPEWDLIEGAKS